MRVLALIGKSGTGKSHHAISVAKQVNADCIIDDGLLIGKNCVLAGSSSKSKKTKIESVKNALLFGESQMLEMKNAIKYYDPNCILILGTSEKMVNKIAERLSLGRIDKIINIEDVATDEEISLAIKTRTEQGKHVIPVPTFMIKKDFSGYFIRPLKGIIGTSDDETLSDETIIRPTYSYLGTFEISDRVLREIISYEAKQIVEVDDVYQTSVSTDKSGIGIKISISIYYGNKILDVCRDVQAYIKSDFENLTSINIHSIDIAVKNLAFKKGRNL